MCSASAVHTLGASSAGCRIWGPSPTFIRPTPSNFRSPAPCRGTAPTPFPATATVCSTTTTTGLFKFFGRGHFFFVCAVYQHVTILTFCGLDVPYYYIMYCFLYVFVLLCCIVVIEVSLTFNGFMSILFYVNRISFYFFHIF